MADNSQWIVQRVVCITSLCFLSGTLIWDSLETSEGVLSSVKCSEQIAKIVFYLKLSSYAVCQYWQVTVSLVEQAVTETGTYFLLVNGLEIMSKMVGESESNHSGKLQATFLSSSVLMRLTLLPPSMTSC